MAFNLGKPRAGRYRPLSEINVTPLVDVMLVLLVIFMVTAPLMTTSVNIDLPKVAATPVNQAPCAVEKSDVEQASPAKNSRPSTGAASAARHSAMPGSAYE